MAKVHYNGNAYGIDVHTDTLTLIIGFVAVLTFAVFTCRRFHHEPLAATGQRVGYVELVVLHHQCISRLHNSSNV